MAFDKSKVLKTAEKFIAGGKIAQALEEYQKILKENPKDWALMIQIGDLMLKVNRSIEAIEYFQTVADHYNSDGFFLKAIAIYKRINKLDPSLTDVCIKLADLYLKQGLTMDAKSQLQMVAQNHLSKNQTKEAIQTLQRLVEIEPDNLRTRNELAKAYKSEGMIPESIQEYLAISDHLTRKNLTKENVAVLETAYKLDPKNVEILRKILAVYSELKEPNKATALLEESLRSDPSNVDVMALVAESYVERKDYARAHELIDRAIMSSGRKESLWELKGDLHVKTGELDKAYSQYYQVVEKEIQRKDLDRSVTLMEKIVEADSTFHPAWQKLVDLFTLLRQNANLTGAYGSLADAYIAKKMYSEAASCLKKLIKLDPDDSQHQEKLKFVSSFLEKTKPGTRIPVKEYEVEAAIPDELHRSDFNINLNAETLPGLPAFESQPAKSQVRTIPQTSAARAPVAPAPAAKVSDPEKEFVSEHLIEAEVFNKYGLIDKSIEQLHVILSKYPDSVLARQKLKEVLLEKGDRDRAVDECIRMSRIFRKQNDLDQAEDLLSEARQINPNHPALEKAFQELSLAGPQSTREIAREIPAKSVVESPAKEVPAKPVQVKGSAAAKGPSIPTPAKSKSVPSLKDLLPQAKKQAGAREVSQSLKNANALGEIEKLAQTIRTQSGTFRVKPVAPPPKPAPEVQPPPVPAEEEIVIEIEEPAEAVSIPVAAVPAATPSLVPGDFEEIDFYIEQGLVFDAQSLLLALKEKHPADPGVLSRLDRLKESKVSVPEAAAKEIPVAEEEISIEIEDADSSPEAKELQMPEMPGSASGAGLEVLSSKDEIDFHLDEDLIVSVPEQVPQPRVPAVESLPEISLDLEAPGSGQEQTGMKESPAATKESVEFVMEEERFVDFGELEDSAASDMKGSEKGTPFLPELSLEESLEQAVDAVFVTQEEAAKQEQEPAEEEEESKPAAVKEALFEEEDDFFDLAAELEEGLLNVQSAVEDDRPPDGQNYSLEEILSDFKKGVDKQLGAEDYDTRYNLGIAYKEMGLVDEAIAEFQVASKDTKRLLECCSMLGLCFVEKGMARLAVKWYQKGLEAPGYSEEEYQGLRYDLALAYESMGEHDKALEIFQEVYGISASYRNVAKKIKEMRDQLHKK